MELAGTGNLREAEGVKRMVCEAYEVAKVEVEGPDVWVGRLGPDTRDPG